MEEIESDHGLPTHNNRVYTANQRGSNVVRRLNISLPERTVELIDRIAGKGQRSALIDRAVLRFVQQESRASIRAQLAAGARDRAARDLQLAEEWFPIETTSEDPPA